MRGLWTVIAAVTLVGCGSSTELRARSEQHAQLAQGAAARGDWHEAKKETARAQRLYDRAAVRAWETRQPVPPPPQTPPALPVAQW